MIKTKKKQTKRAASRKKKRVPDERIPKLIGSFLVLLSLYICIALISYIFTWKADQDTVLKFSWELMGQSDLKVENWLGRLGAFTSHAMFYWGFGLASFAFVYLAGRFGLLLVARKPLTNFFSRLKYVALGIVFTSLVLEFIFHNSSFSWGGAFGESTSFWLENFLGKVGLFLFLLFSVGGMIIWLFNPNLHLLDRFPRISRFFSPLASLFTSERKEGFAVASGGIGSLQEEESSLQPNFLDSFRATFKHKKDDAESFESVGKETDVADNQAKAVEAQEIGEQLEFEMAEKEGNKKGQASKVDLAELEIEEQTNVEITEGKDNAGHAPDNQPVISVAEENKKHSEPYDPKLDLSKYVLPNIELLNDYSADKVEIDRAELEANKDQIIETLLNYKIEITKIRATIGPTVTLYEIVPAPGVRISRIKNLEDDIALSLAALGIRIIAPIPGKGTIGIEVPNKKKQIVSLRETVQSEKFLNAKMDLPIALGKTISNEVFVADLAKMPHLLIAGATGQGKSVGINAVIMSLLYKKHPSQLKLILIDPKKVELFPYSRLIKHYLACLPGEEEAIITETKKVVYTLNSLCIEMDQRYDLLKKGSSRNIREYNEKFVNRHLNPNNGHRFLPFIVLVVDEFADLIMTAGKEVELPIARLAQLARAVGIHLIIATQRPSVNIITGVIKANFPARLAFKVTSKVDSRTILDIGGAEQLIGRGDMLLTMCFCRHT